MENDEEHGYGSKKGVVTNYSFLLTNTQTRSTISLHKKCKKYKKIAQEVQGGGYMKTIVIANQKGGIGKTTTSTALASILTEKGYKTLLIDTDVQCNSSDTYRAKIKDTSTLYDVLLDDDRISLKEAIQHTEMGDTVAADPLLRRAGSILDADRANGVFRLKDALEELEGYDYVVVDTAPSMNSLLQNCLVAADEVVIPLTADRYSVQGLSELNNTINATKKRQNPNLNVAGLLLVKYNKRTLLSKEVKESLEEIAEKMRTKLFTTTIRESTKAREAQATCTTLIKYDSNSTTARDYYDFANELIGEK